MNDIHSLLYAFLKQNKSGKDLENIIVNKIEQQIKEIEAENTEIKILKPYKENHDTHIDKDKLIKDLEQEQNILEQLIKEQNVRQKEYNDYNTYQSENKIIKEIRDREEKHRLQNQLKKRFPEIPSRKNLLYYKEKGKIGVWLANDMKRFMPTQFKEQWRGYHHSLLQKLLAYYDQYPSRNEIGELLKKCSFSDAPFDFEKCLKKQTLSEFYEMYLSERLTRISYLVSGVKETTNNKELKLYEKECFKSFKKQHYIYNQLDTQIQRILAYPIFLERGFLDEKPTMIEGVKFEDNNKDLFADWFVYYKSYSDYQKFYDTSEYPLTQLNEKQEFEVFKQINKQKKNDVYTLMMAKYIFKQLFVNDSIGDFNLKDLYQSREERLQNAAESTQNQTRNENYIWNKEVDTKILDKVILKGIKLKKIGNYRKYETDDRVRTLLEYQPEITEWKVFSTNMKEEKNPIHILDIQLSSYENERIELFKEVHHLEEYILNNNNLTNENILKNDSGDENFKCYILNGLLKQIKKVDVDNFTVFKTDINPEKVYISQLKEANNDFEQMAYVLVYIRNVFAHNKLPKKAFFEYCEEKYGKITNEQTYAEYFAEIFSKAKCDLLGK